MGGKGKGPYSANSPSWSGGLKKEKGEERGKYLPARPSGLRPVFVKKEKEEGIFGRENGIAPKAQSQKRRKGTGERAW